MGGGNAAGVFAMLNAQGLSPRGRGKPTQAYPGDDHQRSIPAWAGETGGRAFRRGGRAVYPRVGGGNAPQVFPLAFLDGLSPRGRGKPEGTATHGKRRRSIPAWAGETVSRRRKSKPTRVYPRVGGGNAIPFTTPTPAAGLSPRGRGKLVIDRDGQLADRSIPAWAGETTAVP